MAIKIQVKVVPKSGKLDFFIDKSGSLKCYLKQPAENGKANQELIKFMAKKLSLPQEAISITLGATSRTKLILIQTTLDEKTITMHLCDHVQTSLLPKK